MDLLRFFKKQETRIKIAITIIVIVFTTSLIAFYEIENLSWLDSIYLMIVTVSMVGFGDVAPTQPVKRSISIGLIITGISSIAFLSKFFINNLIKARLEERLDLPPKILNSKDHIIIGGYNGTTRNIARYYQDRFYKVLILEKKEIKTKLKYYRIPKLKFPKFIKLQLHILILKPNC